MNKHTSYGFTIVELLVVIVVIGILAAITVVSYTGISNKAIISSLQSDLSSASKQLKMFSIEKGSFPTTISTNCTTTPTTTTNLCLKQTPGNSFTSTPYSNPTSQSFILTAVNGSNAYYITENSSPIAGAYVAPIWIPGQAETGYPTALVGKYIYYMDAAGTPAWRNSAVYCSAPQCSTTVAPAPDVSYPSNMVLVDPIANSGVTFGATYPAQEACKTLGGRLPTMNELSAIYAGKVAGRYGTFPGDLYWSATETNSAYAYVVLFGSNPVTSDKAYTGNYTRCVK